MKLFIARMTFFIGFLLVLFLLFPAGCTQESELPPDEMMFTIVHTNDIHGRVSRGENEEIGFALIAKKVEELRQQGENILLLDAGDAFHGTAYAVLHRGESVVAVMNAMGYDAMVPGNHDFNYGTDRLMELKEIAEFPLIAANISTNDEPLFPPYVIIESGEYNVAVFGLVTQETMFKNHPDNIVGVSFHDPIQSARNVVEELKGKDVQMIIALTHLGYYEEDDTVSSNQLAASVDGIDLIIDGHSHHFFPDGLMINGTVIVQAGYHGHALGLINVTSRGNELVEIAPSLLTIEQLELLSGYAPVADIITSFKELSEPILNEVIASSDIKLIGDRELVRTRSTNLGQLITAAMLKASEADVAMINGGSIRSSIESGLITRGDMLNVFPFGNNVVVLEVSGEDLVAMLEIGLSEYPEPSGAYPHTAGIEYVFDEEGEAGNRTSGWQVGGHPLEPQGLYRFTTNDFIAAGGDRYDIFINKKTVAEYGNLDELLTDYLASLVNIEDDFSN